VIGRKSLDLLRAARDRLEHPVTDALPFLGEFVDRIADARAGLLIALSTVP